MRVARVFPSKTNATPTDKLAFFSSPPKKLSADRAEISVTFSFDKPYAEKLYDLWSKRIPTRIGGPAYGDRGGEFTPGKYLKSGYTITSRGCPNRCWFCDVWKREGQQVRELRIKPGWNLLDSNLLACSDSHIAEVFKMLGRQPRRAELTGGLEAARLKYSHVNGLWQLRPKQIFFAYDTPDDYEPLVEAGRVLRLADFTRSHLRCYVLIGWAKDTREAALGRLLDTWRAGFLPMAMLYRGKHSKKNSKVDRSWERFQRTWARPPAVKAELKKGGVVPLLARELRYRK